MPQGRCNEPCSPGYRKAPNGGYHVCCYNCVPCSEGEVSNITDKLKPCGALLGSELQEHPGVNKVRQLASLSAHYTNRVYSVKSQRPVQLRAATTTPSQSSLDLRTRPRPVPNSDICHKCPEEEWPDEKREKCILKPYEFLSYEKDILIFVFLGLSLLFSIITLCILGIFIYYWDTPIVKANNRTVSFILLVSILLGFLCVFFFLGRPVAITCLLRQTSFGIFFSIGVSSVLSKTITVCIVFKATKPGSVWVKWISPRVSYSVVLVCSSVQVLICVIWLLVSPPYVEFDHQSYPGKIIIQCNEGSDLWFYSMLGYMGLLAAVSFLLAFMVRTLPESFNEAKYITFSMLLFCSVWMAMIPAYLSTRGKYMTIVEIFAILTSCAGVLGCIFFPKLYILLLKPELNCRKNIKEKN
ncbi:vomeronasal type-2 receptor 26-like [Leptodactylus fuscus]|uniref:vomeronasal type-2 receptor 26-like n=1 Tax=Leptodactylus fuscus TaxID=238119 RepID=UPI003F4E988A